MRKISKRLLALFLVLTSLITLIVPAFSGTINVAGQGGTSLNVSGGGAYTYNNADQMWKISVFYARHDTSNEKTSTLTDTSHWVQYGRTFYMYNPDASRGASGKIQMKFFEKGIFLDSNKPKFLGQTTDVSKVNATVTLYKDNVFYKNSKSPAIAMNGYSNDDVKSFFKEEGNLIKLAQEAYKAAGYSNWTSGFGNTTFQIDGFNGNYVDKTANSGKAVNGYVWSTATKHLTFNDWYKGVKTDYNGKQIYLHPKVSGDSFLAGTTWMLVYEPVLAVEVAGFNIGGTIYKYVCCTPTEFAILQQNGIISLGSLKNTVFNYLSNSTILDSKWVGINTRSSSFTKDTALNTIYQQAGIGMTKFNSYNYVIKDYKAVLSAPKSVKAGEAFNVTFTHSNISEEWKGNTGKHESAINVKYVWVAYIKQGTQEYWFDLWNLRGKTLSKSTALKKSDGSLVTAYADAASIVEARRANQSNGLSPFNKSKHNYRGAKDSNGNYIDRISHTYSYTVSSEFSGCNLDLRAYTNADSVGEYTNSKKELNSGAYYKSGESQYRGNNRGRKVVSVTASPEVEPVISVQLNNKTSNENLNLAGKRFAVWCIGATQYSTTKGVDRAYELIPCTNTSNAGWVGVITTDANGYGELNLADANVGSGQDINGTSNSTANRTATGMAYGFFGTNFTYTGGHWMPGGQNKNGVTYYYNNSYWQGNAVMFEHPYHGQVDTSKYSIANNVVTNKSTGAVVTGFTPSYEIQATKADGYVENCRPLRQLGAHGQYLPTDTTIAKLYGIMFAGGDNGGGYEGKGKYNLYAPSNPKMTFVIRPINDSGDATTKYNYGGKELKVFGYVNENGQAVTTQTNRITFSNIRYIYDSSLTGTTVNKPNTTNYLLNTDVANCPIKCGILALNSNTVVYEDLVAFNFDKSSQAKGVTIDVVEEPGTVVVNYAKGSGCTISSFQGAKVSLHDSSGGIHNGTLNASGSVTFTNIPAGPYTVHPIVKGDNNCDGNLCACDGSITQLSTAIDVGCNIYSSGHYITPFITESPCGADGHIPYRIAPLGEGTYITLAGLSGTVVPQQTVTSTFTVEMQRFESVNPKLKVSVNNYTDTETVIGKQFGVYAVFFNSNTNKYGINLENVYTGSAVNCMLGTITIGNEGTDEQGNQTGYGTLDLTNLGGMSTSLGVLKSYRGFADALWNNLSNNSQRLGAFLYNKSGTPLYDSSVTNNMIIVVRPLNPLKKSLQKYEINGSPISVFDANSYVNKNYAAFNEMATDSDGEQYVANTHLGFYNGTASLNTKLYSDVGIVTYSETSVAGDYWKEISFSITEPKAGITVKLNKTNSLHQNDNPTINFVCAPNDGSAKSKDIVANSQGTFDKLGPSSYTVTASNVPSSYTVTPTSQNVNFTTQAAIDAGSVLSYTIDRKGTIIFDFKINAPSWLLPSDINGKTITMYKDGSVYQTQTISDMKVTFSNIEINNSSFTFKINDTYLCHKITIPAVSHDDIKNTYNNTEAYVFKGQILFDYDNNGAPCKAKYNIKVNYLDGATYSNVGNKITFYLNGANAKTSTKSTDLLSTTDFSNLIIDGTVSASNPYNVTVNCSDSNFSVTLVSGDPTNTVGELRAIHNNGHTIDLVYEVRLVKRDLAFRLNTNIAKPTLFNNSTFWENPIGQNVTVSLYNSSNTLVSTKVIAVADNSYTQCSFGYLPKDTYKITVVLNCNDTKFFTDGNYNTVCTQYSVTHNMGTTASDIVNGYLKNYYHKIKINYATDYDTGFKGNYFQIQCTNEDNIVSSATISNDVEYYVPYGFDLPNSYTITQLSAPQYYELSTAQSIFTPTEFKDESHTASFSNKYIWDFSITITANTDFVIFGDVLTYTVTVTNNRPKEATPTVYVYWDNIIKQNLGITIPANSSKTNSYTYTITTSELIGDHILTAYVNQDAKYYEKNTSDNISQFTVTVGGNYMIEGLTPDAEYMRGYEAIASCYVSSDIPKDTLTKDNLDVDAKLKYISQNGSTKTVQLERYENLVVPSNIYVNNKNIAYFKLTIPTDAKVNSQAEVVFTVNPDKAIGEYDYSDNTVSIKNVIINKTESNPETLGRELKIPTGYYGTTVTPEIENSIGERAWSQWSEKSDGTLQIDTYTTNTSIDSVVKIDNRCISAIWKGNNLNMRSGYAFTIKTNPLITINKNGSAYSEDRMITTFQSARVYYPEFRYSQELGKYTELEVVNSSNANTSQFSVYSPYFKDKDTGKNKYANTQDVGMVSASTSRYELPINDVTSFQELGRKHFVPIFWKDGEYNLQLYATQLWCPVGVVSTYDYAKTAKGGKLIIEGSVYDDYYTVRG
jgi:hypothetical protein